MFKRYFSFVLIVILSTLANAQDEKWIDMGVKSDNGGVLYWASSELINRNGKIELANEGEEGTRFILGDIKGTANISPLVNMPNIPLNIKGNPEFDIATANLGSTYRLPSPNEINTLLENCDIRYAEYNRPTDGVDENGIPLWVQGQWIYTGSNGYSVSFKFDGLLVSVIQVSELPTEVLYEGTYIFSQNTLSFWDEVLEIDEERKLLKRKNGEYLTKGSNESSKTRTRGFLLKSRINQKQLFFAIPPSITSGKSGNATISWENPKEGGYWSGNLMKMQDDVYGMFLLINGGGHGIAGEPIGKLRCYVKPVKVSEEEIANSAQTNDDAVIKNFNEDAYLQKLQEEKLKKDPCLFIEYFYNNYVFGSKNFEEIAESVCSRDFLQYLKDEFEYDCPDGDCYAIWLFRSGAQDGIDNGKGSHVINVRQMDPTLFEVTYYDMGYKYSTVVVYNGKFCGIGKTVPIDHEITWKAYQDSIQKVNNNEGNDSQNENIE